MASPQEIYSELQTKALRPIPGSSLVADPENPSAFEKPPKFTALHPAANYIWEQFTDEENYINLMTAISQEVPLVDIAQVFLFAEFKEGAWNPDLLMMLIEPTVYMLMALAERAEIEMVIYNGDLDDDDEEEMLLNTAYQEDTIRKMIEDSKTGNVPEGVLTAKMQESFASLPKLPEAVEVEEEEAQPSLMQAPAVLQQSQSLMAPPTGV